MKASEFKFKVTNKDGVSAIISLDDIYGYEGEVSGVFVKYNNKDIPKELYCAAITFNDCTSNELEFEHIN